MVAVAPYSVRTSANGTAWVARRIGWWSKTRSGIVSSGSWWLPVAGWASTRAKRAYDFRLKLRSRDSSRPRTLTISRFSARPMMPP